MGVKKVSIIILTFNNLAITIDCINSIRQYTKKGTYEIIVVDNNSSDGTKKWLKEQEDIRTIFNEENLGFPKGCNIGLEIAEKDNDILLLNNDTIVTPRWLDNLSKALNSSEEIGAVGPLTSNSANQQTVEVSYKTMEELIAFSDEFNKYNPDTWEEKIMLMGFCLLFKRDVINKVGFLDERFTPGNFEETDLVLRIIKEGYKLILCRDTFIHHIGSATFNENPEIFNSFYVNRKKIDEKWGFNHDLVANVNLNLINFIKRDKNEKLNILEIGCGSGMNLLKLKYYYKNASLYGIEKDEKIRCIAEKLVNLKTLDTKNNDVFPLDYEKEFFDYIILNYELHGVEDPVQYLKEIKKHLKKDGVIICKIKNIAYIGFIKNILGGSFYRSKEFKGLNVKNFYTLNDVIDIFLEADLKGVFGSGSVVELSNEDKIIINKLNDITKADLAVQYSSLEYELSFEGINNN